jgi:hypothetical protein
MQSLKQSVAATILVGPLLDINGAPVTSAVIGDFNITKNGTTAAMAAAATATHSHNGYYLLALTTGNTDTLGRLVISANNAAHSMATHRYMVQPASVFDALFTNAIDAAGGLGDAKRFAGQVITAAAGVVLPADVASTTNITSASGIQLAANQDVRNITGTVPAVTLTSGERSTLAGVLEAAMLNEGDATALLDAIAAKVEQFLINFLSTIYASGKLFV